jgi:hypothetical protein
MPVNILLFAESIDGVGGAGTWKHRVRFRKGDIVSVRAGSKDFRPGEVLPRFARLIVNGTNIGEQRHLKGNHRAVVEVNSTTQPDDTAVCFVSTREGGRGPGGENDMSLAKAQTVIENRGGVITGSSTNRVDFTLDAADVPKPPAMPQARWDSFSKEAKIRRALHRIENRLYDLKAMARYSVPAARVDLIIAAGGTQTIGNALFQTILRDKDVTA